MSFGDITLRYRLDCALMVLAMLLAMALLHRWLQRRHRRRVGLPAWGALLVNLVVACAAAEIAGRLEQMQVRQMLESIAPTYASELQRMGHARITLDTPPDDPAYGAMLEAQIRWHQLNPLVSDIYTLRMNERGEPILIVDAETDYNRDDAFSGERETRTAIGESLGQWSPKIEHAWKGMRAFDDVPVTDRWGRWVSAYVPMYDPDGNVEAVLGVDYPADRWSANLLMHRAAMIGVGSLVSIILIGVTGFTERMRAEMALRKAAEQQLVAASREAGMAEVASSVLHNVGNVLNSVNVSAEVLAERLRKSRVGSLSRVAGLINERRDDLGEFLTADTRGRQVPTLLSQLADFLTAEQQSMLDEVSLLARSVEHIRGIVHSQQSFARESHLLEPTDVHNCIEEAIRLNDLSQPRHGIELLRHYGQCPTVIADRHRMLQILVNLLSNAKKAIRDNGSDTRRITIRTETIRKDENIFVRIQVTDTGTGIEPQNLSKIFMHGFTTRTDGHGFGLHASSISARQMGGELTAESPGPGLGATFTLVLPIHSNTTERASQEKAESAEERD